MSILVLNWEIANSGNSLGSIGWSLEANGGWPAFIEDHVQPAIDWAEASNITPRILIHHPFGLYSTDDDDDAMHLDGWDFAKAAGATWLTSNFSTSTAWRSITSDYQCFAYVGGVHLTQRLRNLPADELATTIRRNLKPLVAAGFRGVYVDYAENAIANPFTHPTISAQSVGRSRDTILLEIADSLFTARTGVEAAPRDFDEFTELYDRNIVASDSVWRHRYGGFTSQQIIDYGYGERNVNYVALGYDRSVLTGNVWRTLPYSDDTTTTAELSQLIATEGDIPAISPQPFITQDVAASEVLL
jgi:hypothetical protein